MLETRNLEEEMEQEFQKWVSPQDEVDGGLEAKRQLFDLISKDFGCEKAKTLSHGERRVKGLLKSLNFAYGEVDFWQLLSVFGLFRIATEPSLTSRASQIKATSST